MIKKNILFLLFGSALLVGCGKQIPSDVIKPKKMEEILYDYHLCEAMTDQGVDNNLYAKEEYKKVIFKKYKITKADFDSSLVWYTKNPQELSKIYTDIGEKFRKQNIRITNILNNKKREKQIKSGNVVDIWDESSLVWLTPSSLSNKINFQIIADSTFKENDRFALNADFAFLSKGNQKAYVGLNIILDNDSIIGRTNEISNNHALVSVRAVDGHNIRSVNGFIYYKTNENLLGLLVNNIKLMKYHMPKVQKSTIQQDTAQPASINSFNTIDTVSKSGLIDTSNTNEIQIMDVPVVSKGDEVREKLKQRKQ